MLNTTKSLYEVCLNQPLLQDFQKWFQEDLSHVKIFVFSSAKSNAHIQTPLAFASRESIFLSDLAAISDLPQITSILAHEYAHITQKRRARTTHGQRMGRGTTLVILEEEAHRAALAFRVGEECPELSPDASPATRMWGPAGHYYTVYWVARFVGLLDSHAEKLAFYAQMPDQVKCLDAATVGKVWFKKSGPRSFFTPNDGRLDEYVYRIQAGLHCLNNRKAEDEWKRLETILRKLRDDNFLTFSFGLGLHPLGDSYAHVKDNGNSFLAPWGHFGAGRTFDERIFKYGTTIDDISKHPDMYRKYCNQLFGVLADRFNPSLSAEKRRSAAIEFDLRITEVTCQANEGSQISAIKKFYPDKRSHYGPKPGDEPLPWSEFQMRYPSLISDWTLQKTLELAEAWTVAPG